MSDIDYTISQRLFLWMGPVKVGSSAVLFNRYRRSRTFNQIAPDSNQQCLNTRPFNIAVNRSSEDGFKSFPVPAVHGVMITYFDSILQYSYLRWQTDIRWVEVTEECAVTGLMESECPAVEPGMVLWFGMKERNEHVWNRDVFLDGISLAILWNVRKSNPTPCPPLGKTVLCPRISRLGKTVLCPRISRISTV